MKKSIFGIIALLVLTVSGAMASEAEARYKARVLGTVLEDRGYTLKSLDSGYLRQNHYRTFAITLYSGNSYAFIGTGDSNVYDLDVTVYDENWNKVAWDNDSSDKTVVQITPRWSGTYHVRTKVYSGRGYWAQISAWY